MQSASFVHRRHHPVRTAAALACVLFAGSMTTVGAQAPQAAAPAEKQPAAPRVTAGWRDGFYIESEKGDFRLQIGALVHADGRFGLADENEAVSDTFLIRRLRPYIRGRIAQRFEFYLNPDFAGGTLVVQDAYLDTIVAPAFRIRAGKAKSPFGLERLHSAANLLFFERALPTAVAPNRDVGVQVLGDLHGGLIGYMAGVMNGVADGTSADLDASDSKDVVGRLILRPFSRNPDSPLRGLTAALAASSGKQTGAGALPAYRTAALQQPFFSYSSATADGTRTRYSPQVSYYFKSFGAIGEYVHSELPVRRGSIREDVAHEAWQVAAAFVLTGEPATDSGVGVRPRANFDFGNGHLGAFQVGARYHVLTIDDRAFALNLAAPGASRKAESWTLGVNWYLTPQIKYVLNFERTVFDAGTAAARRPENAIAFRTQLNF